MITATDQMLLDYLDGTLSEDQSREIDGLLERDPSLVARMEALMVDDTICDEDIKEQFDAMLHEPIPLSLAALIKNTPIDDDQAALSQDNDGVTDDAGTDIAHVVRQTPSNQNPTPSWYLVAASVAILSVASITGIGGFYLGQQQSDTQQTASLAQGWVQQVAEYHGVYAAEKRHLVEVRADESDHIEKWLGNVVNVPFAIPDLEQYDLEFQGARLLVANGKPVGQLMYTLPNGTVVAICFIENTNGGIMSDGGKTSHQLEGFDIVSWNKDKANILVIGPENLQGIDDIAASISL